jgi:hypothetical protein
MKNQVNMRAPLACPARDNPDQKQQLPVIRPKWANLAWTGASSDETLRLSNEL